MLKELYHKTSFPRPGSSWWPREALAAWQALAPGLALPCPVCTGCAQPAASPAYVLPPVQADGNGQLWLLPAWHTCCPCTSLKLCAIIPLFAFPLHKICLLVCPGVGMLFCRTGKCLPVLLQFIPFGTLLSQLHQPLLTAKMPAERHVGSCLLKSVKVEDQVVKEGPVL